MSSGVPIIWLQGLSIGYRGPHLLDDVDCRIFAGERIGLLGRNGAGKTTLLRLLCGEETPDHGRVELADGTRVALLPQDVPAEIDANVLQVVSEGLPAAWRTDDQRCARNNNSKKLLGPCNCGPMQTFGA